MSLFRLDASILPASSASRSLADLVEAEWTASHPDSTVTRRDLAADPVPATAWADAVTGGFVDDSQRTPAQREARALATTFADELIGADALLFAVPLYNYGVSQHFKAWADLVITGAGPTTPVLKGTPTVLVTSLGGGYGPGAPRHGWDHSTPYLERVIGDIWGADLTVIKRELTLAATTPGMESLRDLAEEQHRQALSAAREAGRVISGN
jgi:FMN-dependent NADH-azoreductase